MKNVIPNYVQSDSTRLLSCVLLFFLLTSVKAAAQCCPPDVGRVQYSTSAYSVEGEISSDDPQIILSDASCFADTAVAEQNAVRYLDVQQVYVSHDNWYMFHLPENTAGALQNQVDFAIYRGFFDPDFSCERLIARSKPAGLYDGNVRMVVYLEEGETYALATTSTSPMATGSYEYAVRAAVFPGRLGTQFDTSYVTNPDWTITPVLSLSSTPFGTLEYELPLYCRDFDAVFNQSSSLALTGQPGGQDDCEAVENISFTDEFTSHGDCGEIIIERTFTYDLPPQLGLQCEQEIRLDNQIGNGREAVWMPAATVALDCDEPFDTLSNGLPALQVTGAPFLLTIDGIKYFPEDSYCSIGATYEDSEVTEFCNGYRFTRSWIVVDWCNPANLTYYDQEVEVGDANGPEIVQVPEQSAYRYELGVPIYQMNPFECIGNIRVPEPELNFTCTDYEVYAEVLVLEETNLLDSAGQIIGTQTDTTVVDTILPGAEERIAEDIPGGRHLFFYRVTDECGNVAERYLPFEVRDFTAPAAICNDELEVEVFAPDSDSAVTRITVDDINDGSWDNCGISEIKIRRGDFDPANNTCGAEYGEWRDYVDFRCCDAGNTIEVYMEVTDEAGISSVCWVEIVPQGPMTPTCIPPPGDTISWADLPDGFNPENVPLMNGLFGHATAIDACGEEYTGLEPIITETLPELDYECQDIGYITRHFVAQADNDAANSEPCEQRIVVLSSPPYDILFPRDEWVSNLCDTVGLPKVAIENENGRALGVSFEDEYINPADTGCYQIVRTWRVIDSCVAESGSEPFIIDRDADCDGIAGEEDVWLLARPNTLFNPFADSNSDGTDDAPRQLFLDRDNNAEAGNTVPPATENDCNGQEGYWSSGYSAAGVYEYTQHIYVEPANTLSFELEPLADYYCVSDIDCRRYVGVPIDIDAYCSRSPYQFSLYYDENNDGNYGPDILEEVVDGLDATLQVAPTELGIDLLLPPGQYRFRLEIRDGCGNQEAEEFEATVINCDAISPVCESGQIFDLQPADLDGDGLPDGGTLTINTTDLLVLPTNGCASGLDYAIGLQGQDFGPGQDSLLLDCSQLGPVPVEVRTYLPDGSTQSCEAYLLLQDGMGACGDGGLLVGGEIVTATGESIEGVDVYLSGPAADTTQSNASGIFSFSALLADGTYTTRPYSNDDPANGVSTLDIVLISKHILGLEPLSSPYKLIAADVNNSGNISTLDLIQIRRLILAQAADFANNTSWRFVAQDYVFTDPAQALQSDFPESISTEDTYFHDYIGVKIGDVNDSATPTGLQSVEPRYSGSPLMLRLPDQPMGASQEYRLPVYAPQLPAYDGWQATLESTPGVRLLRVEPGQMGTDCFGTVHNNRIRISYTNGLDQAVSTEAPLFWLVVQASAKIYTRQALRISESRLRAEAYAKSGQIRPVSLDFGSSSTAFELLPNQPNPFREETLLRFRLPEGGPAHLRVQDVNGRLLHEAVIDGQAGLNTYRLPAEGLPKGLLFVSLQYAGEQRVRKMVAQ